MASFGAERYAWDKMTNRTPDLSEAIGRQRTDYAPPQSMLGMLQNHGGNQRPSMLNRRLHSGDMNMLNRRRRVQPRQLGGKPRFSFRNNETNRGTFGIGQGFNR